MRERVEAELSLFESFLTRKFSRHRLERFAKHAHIVYPSQSRPSPQDPIVLTISAVVHGNEVYGIRVLNDLLFQIEAGLIDIPCPMALVVANYRAAQQGTRFIDRDLNRSFDSEDSGWEVSRAKELAPLFARTKWLLDLHQTIQPSERPFFIFPYSPAALTFANKLHPSMAMVTHWGAGFSKDGIGTTEYVNAKGGVGITVEAGQAGFDDHQIALGLNMVMRACELFASEQLLTRQPTAVDNDIFTWNTVCDYPKTGTTRMHAGWKNFSEITRGQEVATVDDDMITADSDGWMLFPKYVDAAEAATKRPAELFRIVKRIGVEQLPS